MKHKIKLDNKIKDESIISEIDKIEFDDIDFKVSPQAGRVIDQIQGFPESGFKEFCINKGSMVGNGSLLLEYMGLVDINIPDFPADKFAEFVKQRGLLNVDDATIFEFLAKGGMENGA